jgi:hypothetical protein
VQSHSPHILLNLDRLLTIAQIEKLFDIACCLADVVAVTSFSPDAFALGPRDYVSRFLTLISTLRGGHCRYLPLLRAKLSEFSTDLPLSQTISAPAIGMPCTEAALTNMVYICPTMSTRNIPLYDLPSQKPVASPSRQMVSFPLNPLSSPFSSHQPLHQPVPPGCSIMRPAHHSRSP